MNTDQQNKTECSNMIADKQQTGHCTNRRLFGGEAVSNLSGYIGVLLSISVHVVGVDVIAADDSVERL